MIERKELSREDISRRAHELYVERGRERGKDVEDWVRAEKELSGGPNFAAAKTRAAHAGQTN
jgi:hypothetical protein